MQAAAVWIGLIVMKIAWEAPILVGQAKLDNACKPKSKNHRLSICSLRR